MGRKLDKIIVVDLESACWRGTPPPGQMNEIIEIGIVTIETKSLSIIDKDSYIIKPKFSKISDFCTQLTSITQEMVDQGQDFEDICSKISIKYNTKSRIWASYGEYDKNHLKNICNFFDVKYPFSDMHWNIKTMASIFYGFPEMGLDKLLNKLNIKMEGRHHRGSDDAYNIAKILIDILSKGRREI